MSDKVVALPVIRIERMPELTEIERAVAEWRDARRAFLDVPPVPVDPKQRFPAEVWTRLGHAEHRLMKLADALREG